VTTIRFGDCALDLDRVELCRDGAPVAIEPQVFDVLAYLLTHRDRVVPKHELLDEVWGTRFVSESALTSRVKSARRALGDTGRDQRIIRTVHGRGYRFVALVDEGANAPTIEPFDQVLEQVLTNADPVTRQRLRAAARDIVEAAANAALAVVADALSTLEGVA
jgi:DNA-binding winged helix-turn-helix (wHTH) protein